MLVLYFLGLPDYPESQAYKKMPNRRREPRRHTLQNGVDCNMVWELFFARFCCLTFTCSILSILIVKIFQREILKRCGSVYIYIFKKTVGKP